MKVFKYIYIYIYYIKEDFTKIKIDKNKSILFQTLYQVNPKLFLKILSKNA